VCCTCMCGSVRFVVDGWVVFGVVVCPIVAAFVPVVMELMFGFLALGPPLVEVHGLGLLWDDGKVGDAIRSGVVGLDGSAWLSPIHFDEGLLEGDHFFGCDVGSTEFGLSSRRHDKFYYLGD
jgi:hypothetical protein